MINTALLVLPLCLFVWFYAAHIRRRLQGEDQDILPRINNEFRALVVDGPSPELSFDGRTAEIIHDRYEGDDYETAGTFTLHRIHRFARNAYGEYFYFISDGSGSPFFKHITQSNAKIALGKKYIAPERRADEGQSTGRPHEAD